MADFLARVAVRARYLLAASWFTDDGDGEAVVQIRAYSNLPGATIVACNRSQIAIIHDDLAIVEGPPQVWSIRRRELKQLLRSKFKNSSSEQVWACLGQSTDPFGGRDLEELVSVEYPASPLAPMGRRMKRFAPEPRRAGHSIEPPYRVNSMFETWREFVQQHPVTGEFNHSSWVSSRLLALLVEFMAQLGSDPVNDHPTWFAVQTTLGRDVVRVSFKQFPEAIVYSTTLQGGRDDWVVDDNAAWLKQIA